MAVLIDGHCHPVLAADLDEPAFARWCTEADQPAPPGVSYLDSQVGLAVRRWCPPVLGLDRHAPMGEYLDRRAELGWRAASSALLRAAGLAALLVDTGLDGTGLDGTGLDGTGLVDLATLAEFAGAGVHEVVRLERVAETLAGLVDAADFAAVYQAELAVRVTGAVAVKSIVAYRYGLDLPPERPSPAEVRRAAGEWFAAGRPRLTDPVLLRFVLWAGVDTGLPVQLHTGFGDRDVSLRRADPAQLQPFVAATEYTGVPLVLLHCYPYQRSAGWLALVYPHVYLDVGLTMNHLGAGVHAGLREFLDLAPFGKLLFSSDAYGLPELYHTGAAQFRQALRQLLDAWRADDAMSTVDAERITGLVGAGNARRLYGLPPAGPDPLGQV
jgi:predicted TIM-barrel fold metal-dependent hydrolase